MSDLLKRLKTEVLIGQGPLHTNAEKRGHNLTENASWWAFNHPDAYQEIVKSFFDVGCDFAEAPIGAANRLRLKKFDLQDKAREVSRKLVQLTKEVTPANCYLGCTVGGLDMLLSPIGDASLDEACESCVEQIVIAQDVGIDFIRIVVDSIELMELIVKAVKDHSKLPVAALVTFHPTPKGFRTMMGLDPTTAAKKLEELGVDIVGTICGGVSYKETTAVLREMRASCSKYLYARPNAGVPELIQGKAVHPGTPEQMAKEALNWVEAGAKLIAGCCGTTPEYIAKVVTALK